MLQSQRFPSHALSLVRDARDEDALRARADALRARVLQALAARAAGLDQPELRARAAFGAAAELSAQALFEAPEQAEALARHYLEMARTALRAG